MANNLATYNNLNVPEKMDFMSEAFFAIISGASSQEISGFINTILLDKNENTFVQKLALDRLMDLVFLETIKPRQALTILIDNWWSKDTLLNVKRIKSLYYLYEHGPQEIEEIFTANLSDEGELSAEALFNLGLINMQKGLLSQDMEESIFSLEKSRNEFLSATQMIENRVDADIFKRIVSLTIDIIKGIGHSLENGLKEIADLLFKMEGFSFEFRMAPFYTGFYRKLQGLSNISMKNPKSWLDYRFELTALFHEYATVQDYEIKDRLNLSKLSGEFLRKLNTTFFNPFFSLNFSAEESKISARLSELDQDSDEASFLKNILALSADDLKKKAGNESLKVQLMKLFNQVSEKTINDLLVEHDHLNERERLFKVFEILSIPSAVQVDDAIIRSCLLLQTMRNYYGNYSEDDRNTVIANLLEASGYPVKDQTRRSQTQTGKSAGEVDIFINDKSFHPISIIEALNLDSVKKDYIKLHVDKIFTYDANGLKDNYILVYSNAQNFDSFYKTYRDFVKTHAFKYPVKSLIENPVSPYAELKRFTIIHERNSVEVNMHHIILNLAIK